MIQRRGASQSATFVVAASDSLHQGLADYVCDGVDDQVEINAALGEGNRHVILRAGHYNVNATGSPPWYNKWAIGLDSNTHLELEDGAIITLGNNQHCSVIGNKDHIGGNTNIIISGGRIDGNKANQTEYCPDGGTPDRVGHAVQLYNCTDSMIDGVVAVDTWMHSLMLTKSCRCIIKNCRVYNPGRESDGATYHSQSGILVWLNSMDNTIENNYVINNDSATDQPTACRGIYNSGESNRTHIINNVIRGFQGHDNYGGYGIFFMNDNHDCDISGNTISDCDVGIMGDVTGTEGLIDFNIHDNNIHVDKSPIWVEYPTRLNIINNNIYAGQSWSYGIDVRYGDGINIIGNTINYCTHGRILGSVNVLYANNRGQTTVSFSDSSDVIVIGNEVSNIVALPSTSIVRHNRGFTTENSGTATLASGTTFIAVNHGLNVTPAAGDIVVTPIEDWGNMTKFWIGGYTSTQFTIYADQNPGQDVDFAWKAVVL